MGDKPRVGQGSGLTNGLVCIDRFGVFGTPQQVIDQLDPILDRTPLNRVGMTHGPHGTDPTGPSGSAYLFSDVSSVCLLPDVTCL